MNSKLLLIGQLATILLVLGLLRSVYSGLFQAFRRLHLPAEQRRQLSRSILTALAFWLAILALLAAQGYFYGEGEAQGRTALAFALPLSLIVLLLFSRFFTLILKALPERWLIMLQGFRIVQEGILWMGFVGGFVPVQMTFEWLNYDLMVGFTALMAGIAFFGPRRYRRPEAILWNTFGLISMANLVFISLASLPGPLYVFATRPDSGFLTLAPFIWLPGFTFPLAVALHIFSLKQLIQSRRNFADDLLQRWRKRQKK